MLVPGMSSYRTREITGVELRRSTGQAATVCTILQAATGALLDVSTSLQCIFQTGLKQYFLVWQGRS